MLLSTAALAENGLERFEREVKPQLQLKTFTYKSAEALGNEGFVLNDVVAVMPANHATGDKESTLKIDKVTVEALDFEREERQQRRRAALRQAQARGHDRRRGDGSPRSIPTASRACRWTSRSTTASTARPRSSPSTRSK